MESLLEKLDLVEFGDASYLQHHVRAAEYWDNAMEKCCISQNAYSLSREETQEHTVTPKLFSLMMLRGLRVGTAFSWMAEHRPSILKFYSNLRSASGWLMPPISIPF